MGQILINNATGVTSGAITNVATSVTLVDAAAFPNPAPDYYLATFIGFDGNGEEDSWEVVRVTAKTGSTLTIVRAQEGTSGVAWGNNTPIQARITAGSISPPDNVAITGGTLTGVTINESAVTAHQAALSIGASQVTPGTFGGGGDYTLNNSLKMQNGSTHLIGAMGAITTTGTLDWNDVTNARSGNGHTLLLGTATNGPGGGGYFHAFSFEYSSKSGGGNMTQFAIPYDLTGSNRPVFVRSRYSGTWSAWKSLLDTASSIGTAQLTGTLADAQVAASNVTQHQAAINHDALTNFVAAEHIDWTADAGALNIHVNNITAVPESAVTDHESALTITSAQVSDLTTGPVLNTTVRTSGSFTAGVNTGNLVDTSSAAVTATLPASAAKDDVVELWNINSGWEANSLTVGRNSHKIRGAAEDFVADRNVMGLRLVYVDATVGWLVGVL